MLMVLGMPSAMLMLTLIAMVMRKLAGHSTVNDHSPLACGNANGNGVGNAIHPVSCGSLMPFTLCRYRGVGKKGISPKQSKFFLADASQDPVN